MARTRIMAENCRFITLVAYYNMRIHKISNVHAMYRAVKEATVHKFDEDQTEREFRLLIDEFVEFPDNASFNGAKIKGDDISRKFTEISNTLY